MEPSDQYNFSIFRPRNLHGRKNRNVIFSMLLIWAITVFGFQILLRIIQKPTPEKALAMFESAWPKILSDDSESRDYSTLLNSLILVKGKNMVKPADQKILSGAISYLAYKQMPDTIKAVVQTGISEIKKLKAQLGNVKGEEYLEISTIIQSKLRVLSEISEPYSGYSTGTLESSIFIASLDDQYPESLNDTSLSGLPDIMRFYLTHFQSALTDTRFLGFPFHYFYTAVFLLILFIALCIIYNILVEWRLRKEGIVE
ncbi:MAG: DUF4212 domain-containing protein [Bacteroidales bacterium]|nr:DUF4212 domain-containing protein [Bacteroidales bacterium]